MLADHQDGQSVVGRVRPLRQTADPLGVASILFRWCRTADTGLAKSRLAVLETVCRKLRTTLAGEPGMTFLPSAPQLGAPSQEPEHRTESATTVVDVAHHSIE